MSQLALMADERLCGFLPPGTRPEVHACVRKPDHQGGHALWAQGRVDIVVWLTDDQGQGRELFRGRIGGLRSPLTPVDVQVMAETASGFAEKLADLAGE